ncbi:MAG: PilZ domain-containing protein [Polyangiaceae bacterium]|nr:PilZ domain-containing protein [Polyangiaceae bacterium]
MAILGGSSRPPQRRSAGGSRHEASEHVFLKSSEGAAITGWTLNVSRGGVRVVLEDPVLEGADYDFWMSEQEGPSRRVRVAWLRHQADGEIAGLQFLDVEGSIPSPPDELA